MPASREVRDFGAGRLSAGRRDELARRASEVSDRLGGAHRIEITAFDATTGNAASITSTDAPVEPGDLIEAALRHVTAIAPAFGVTRTAPEFVPAPVPQQTSSGYFAVYVHQQHHGIPIFQADVAVRMRSDRTIIDTVGSVITVEADATVGPAIQVTEAVLRAAEDVARPDPDAATEKDGYGQPRAPSFALPDDYRPAIVAAFTALPPTPVVLEPGPFGAPIQAYLVWFPADHHVVLGWNVTLTLPADGRVRRTVVDAGSGAILYAQDFAHGVAAAGSVFTVNPDTPRQDTAFPSGLATHAMLVPGAGGMTPPRDWVEATETAGDCVIAHFGDDGPPVAGRTGDNNILRFEAADQASDDQKVINLFYLSGALHDLFYLLGFREENGNFQATNRVDAKVMPEPIAQTARFITPPAGTPPLMLMGPVTPGGRHCALDASVVSHEFTHGVSNRLVGGPTNPNALMSPQSLGLGEGWSDFVACVLTGQVVVGSWVVNKPGGIRGFPYDADFPDGFDRLGAGRYVEPHNIGEIWCATLMEMSRQVGVPESLQIVVDAMKLSPTNPSFLNMRDCILSAADAMAISRGLSDQQHATLMSGTWSAFAKFGMGPRAQSNGAQLTGIVGDTSMPDLPAGVAGSSAL